MGLLRYLVFLFKYNKRHAHDILSLLLTLSRQARKVGWGYCAIPIRFCIVAQSFVNNIIHEQQ